MNSQALIQIIDFWNKTAAEGQLLAREVVNKIDLKSPEIVDLVGSRRSGKSSILKLVIRSISDNRGFLYMNFEDPIFLEHHSPQIIEELIDTYKEYFDPHLYYLFFDEIQNIDHWEHAVRKLRDSGLYKIFVTGSSSKLLSGELSSLLSGRHVTHRVDPLTFREFLAFRNIGVAHPRDLVLRKTVLEKQFQDYLDIGGFPEVVLSHTSELIKQYYTDIVQKDIVNRYGVRDTQTLEKMGVFLITNIAQTVSLSSIRKFYGVSHELVAKYWEYFQETFLLYELPRFSYSLKTQAKALKKVYAIDNGLVRAVAVRFSENRGQMLENAVFNHLRRQNQELFYYKGDNNREVDFVVNNREQKLSLVQVAWEMSDAKTKSREFSGLQQAAQDLSIDQAKIMTFGERGEETIGKLRVQILPAWEEMLEA